MTHLLVSGTIGQYLKPASKTGPWSVWSSLNRPGPALGVTHTTAVNPNPNPIPDGVT